jgi:hypothetical protein
MDIACEIDKLEYLQVIPECRGDEESVAAATPPGDAQIREVSGFRLFKGNLAQWRVRWAADEAVSWETFDKLDSAPVRARALELQTAAGVDDEPITLQTSTLPLQKEVRAQMAKTKGGNTDIACAIDKLDYLQVIPECRDDEPTTAGDTDIACAIDKLEYLQVIPECRGDEENVAAATPPADAQIREVSGFRLFKGNLAQWRVRWAADEAVSWETFDKLDSAPVRARALELQTAAGVDDEPITMQTSISPLVAQPEVHIEMAKTMGDDTDIACAIDKLDYLQVIPECRDDEPTTADDSDIACAIDKLEYLQVIPECRDDEPIATDNTDIACEIDKLDYLQVIPECRDDEPIAADDTDIACAIDKLDYLQVIPECRDDEPIVADDTDIACEIDKLEYLQVIPECRDEEVSARSTELDAALKWRAASLLQAKWRKLASM